MPRIARIATAVPDLDFEQDYLRWALRQLGGKREAQLYERMAQRSGIEHRWSVLSPEDAKLELGEGLYGADDPPGTAQRMAIYAEAAPADGDAADVGEHFAHAAGSESTRHAPE